MEKTTAKDQTLRVLAILGVVAILILGAWGIIQIAFALPNLFNGTPNTPATTAATSTVQEQLSVTAPSILTTGQPFTLSWTHTGGTANYSYAVSYSCATGLSMQAPLPTGSVQSVPCNTPFNFTNATGQLTLTPKLTGTSQVGTTLTVVSNNLTTGAVTSSGSAATTVLPARSVTTATQPAGSTYVAAPTRAALYGLPDLAVTILAVQPPVNGLYSIQFVIANVGTNVTPAGWSFTANLPLQPVYTYQSQPQQKLYPGDKIVYTLGFSATQNVNQYIGSYYNYNNIFTINVDPQGLVQETSRSNNSASVTLASY